MILAAILTVAVVYPIEVTLDVMSNSPFVA